ncbi:hypothetical protein OG555_04240 [Kribbella sp. NBC_01484]|uniref:hypothetical protein n=1 Tax=Kribbella sp. NBC_01484 TaxID=2903579 RepID=UPI002E334A57|nr:hypothetical protein [Kribbella sp. NBC_01484]
MNWAGVRNGRLVAGLYLIAFVSLYGGVVCVVLGNWTGQTRLTLGGFAFIGGLLGIFALSWGLQNRVPDKPGRFTARASNSTRAYQRLASGVELRGAWRTLTGRGASTTSRGSN